MAELPAPLRPVRSGAELDPRYPRRLLLHEGYTYLLTAMDGSIGEAPDEGLFDFDLRLLARHRITIDGRTPVGPATAPTQAERWVGVLGVRHEDGSADGPRLPQDTLELRIDRRVGRGLIERLEVTNHSMVARPADLAIDLAAGFRDVSQLRDADPVSGVVDATSDADAGVLTIRWSATHGDRTVERGLRVSVVAPPPAGLELIERDASDGAGYRFRVPCRLPPHGRLGMTLVYESLVDGRWRSPVDGGRTSAELHRRDRERATIRATRPSVETTDGLAGEVVERALDDVLALRNWDLEDDRDGWIVNAGASKYLGFFARDALTVGRQTIAFGPAPLLGALERAAQTQGRDDVPEREEEPGRIVHEMRRGPLADLGLAPFARYYGSLTGAAAFTVGLADYWSWTGDRDTTRRLLPHAMAALAWAESASRRHPAGLLASAGRAPGGLRNQGWKDSEEAIRDPAGQPVPIPNAPVEEQGWWFRALQRAAQLAETFDEPSAAAAYRERADRIREAVETRYWMPDAGTYAMALDRDAERVESIGSNPLHLLAAGLPAPDRARRLVDRLFARDLWTGWGVRTLSADHPAYDPFAYHLGSVWPVETAAFAEGCRRYGSRAALEVVASAMLAAAAHFHQLRLPEVFTGHDHRMVEVPTVYPTTQTPQAWSAGAVLSVVRSLLGLEARAAGHQLVVDDPLLPRWLPALRLRRLPVGRSTVDLEFERGADGSTSWRVLDGSGDLDVVAGRGRTSDGPG
jgi:glycogen debranching enzyme